MTDRPAPSRNGASSTTSGPREAAQRWRLVVARDAAGPDQREQLTAWESCLAGSGLPLAGLDQAPPRPRFALAAQLPAGMPGEAELVDLWLTERLPRWRVRESLEGRLPPGNRLVDLHDAWLGEPPLPGQVLASVFRVTVGAGGPPAAALGSAAAAMLAASTLPRRRPKGDTTVAYDLRPFLEGVEIAGDGPGTVIRLRLGHDPEKGIGRPEEALAELGDRTGGALPVDSVVRERLVLRERGQAPDPRPPGATRPRR